MPAPCIFISLRQASVLRASAILGATIYQQGGRSAQQSFGQVSHQSHRMFSEYLLTEQHLKGDINHYGDRGGGAIIRTHSYLDRRPDRDH
jgi:hypothetical protein